MKKKGTTGVPRILTVVHLGVDRKVFWTKSCKEIIYGSCRSLK